MAIQTETIIDVEISGIKVDEFGISDTLDNYSDSEIADFIYVGANSRMLGGNLDFYTNNAGSYDTWQAGMPFDTGAVTSSIMTMKSGHGTYDCPAEGRYLGVVLLHNINNNLYNDYITVGTSQNYVLLTEINAKKYLLDISAGLLQVDSRGATTFTDKTADLYNPQFTSVTFKYNNNGTYEYLNYDFVPYYVMEYGGYLYLINAFNINQTSQFRCSFNQLPPWNAGTVYNPLSYNDVSKSISVAFNGYGFGAHWTDISPDDFVWTYGGPAQKYCESDYVHLFADFGARQFRCYYYYKTYDDMMMMYANSGMYFRINGDTIFKPLIDNNVVYGFTDDLDEESDIDNYDGSTKHDIPVTPPTPPTPPTPEGDDYDDMGIGTGTNVGGLTSYAIMSISDLADLIADFNTRLETGQSVVNNFICCYKLGPLSSFLCTTGAHNIIMSAYSTTGNNFVSTRADYAVISSQKNNVLLGTFTVPRKTNTFYDFSPYTTYELFIPCCGWVPLPDSVAGREINVYLVFDLASCVCKGIVRISGTTIAEISGVIGSSVPFYVNDSGLARASLVTGVTQTLSNIAMGAVGAASGNTGLAVMGLGNAVQSAQQTSIAGNTNYTAVRGGNGDMSAYANGEYCTIKITHPIVDTVVETSMFGHSVGYLCEEVGSLSGFHGFTVCANPHVHINATSAERDEITQLLEQGVILPEGE